jgi:hypothetical protein
MANKLKGEVGFEAGGEIYTLVYSLNALCELEEKLGGSVASIEAIAKSGKRFETVRTVFWAGLIEYHPDMKPRDAARLVSMIGFEKADELIGQAFSAAFPEAKLQDGAPLPLEVKPAPTRKTRGRTG